MPLPADAHIGSVSLTVGDLDRSMSFYRDRPRDTWRSANGELAMATDPLDVQSVANEPGAEVPWQGLETGTVVRGYPGALFVSAGGYHHHLGMNTWVGVGAPAPPENAVGLRSFTVAAQDLESRLVDDASTRVVVALVGG